MFLLVLGVVWVCLPRICRLCVSRVGGVRSRRLLWGALTVLSLTISLVYHLYRIHMGIFL